MMFAIAQTQSVLAVEMVRLRRCELMISPSGQLNQSFCVHACIVKDEEDVVRGG